MSFLCEVKYKENSYQAGTTDYKKGLKRVESCFLFFPNVCFKYNMLHVSSSMKQEKTKLL